MNNLKTGQFFGMTNETICLNGITLTDTEYTHRNVDWHFHENAYFTFIIEGKLLEGNKKDLFACDSGTLLFHNCQEAHYNIKPAGFARGFHIELEPKWFDFYEISTDSVNGSLNLLSPQMKLLMYNIFRETKLSGKSVQPAIDSLLIQLFTQMSGMQVTIDKKWPVWAEKIKDLLNDSTEDRSLSELATLLNIHPVHLSRNFSKYFNCNLGDYIRTLKIQRALSMLSERDLSLTQIAFQCNFADQSHFIRAFKTQNKITPSAYRKLFLKTQKC